MNNDVLYLCNGKQCGNGHDCGECRHTLQIEYAANFQRFKRGDGVVFFKEKEPTKSHWNIDKTPTYYWYSCNNCFHSFGDTEFNPPNFCESCGADMREADS